MSIMLLAIVVGVIVAAVAAGLLSNRGRTAGTGEAGCGQCGYNVRGLSTFICPECGGDLRTVGIVSAAGTSRGGRHLFWILPLWTVIVGMSGTMLVESTELAGWLVTLLALLAWIGGIVVIVLLMSRGLRRAGGPLTPGDLANPLSALGDQPATASTAVLTIMFIDMAGFTERTSASSLDGLIDLIRRVRDLVQPVLARRRGRIVKTVGDGFLVAFESPTEAIKCGCDVQVKVSRENEILPDGKLALRIGVATGEAVVESNDVYGDPVNLAARIQQLAPPGEVFFSESTYHAMTRSEVPHEPAGEFEVKGVGRPVNLYRAVIF